MSRLAQPNNIKVCLVTISLGKGGAERSCAMLSQMLDSSGYEVHLVLLNDRINFHFEGALFNLGIYKNGSDSIYKRMGRMSKLRAYLKNEKFDFIIDHRPKNQYYRELFYHYYVYKGFRTIYVTHTSSEKEFFTQFPDKFVAILNKNYRNVAVSKYIEDKVLKEAGVESTVTIHNAYDPKWYEESISVHPELKDKRYILSYGRIVDSIKDFTFLIEAYDASRIWKEQIYLVIMGDGPDKEELISFAQSTAASNYILFLPFQGIPFGVIKNAEFVTLTSKYEGFPMVVVESLSVGVPVVSLDIISGPNEIIEHNLNGLLIKERSIPLFAQAMKRMISESDLHQTCKQNSRHSVRKFSMSEIEKKWNEILTDEA